MPFRLTNPGTRFVAELPNTTAEPSALRTGFSLCPLELTSGVEASSPTGRMLSAASARNRFRAPGNSATDLVPGYVALFPGARLSKTTTSPAPIRAFDEAPEPPARGLPGTWLTSRVTPVWTS